MSGDLVTTVALPLLGVMLLALGWWSRRHLDSLVGTLGPPDLIERRRAVMTRGVHACLVGGVVLTSCSVGLGIVALR